jgi:ring-1,2-phenylacetyl-CoA epoxidase subunit PaaD
MGLAVTPTSPVVRLSVIHRTERTAPIWAVLSTVMDPEVPVLSVVELGIVRDVELDDLGAVTVAVTPTYSGCPAMSVIEADIVSALATAGWVDARVRTVYTPAWTTDWISEAARKKLREYGIAPPPGRVETVEDLVPLRRSVPVVHCPYCNSTTTTTRSEFGSTACKAVMYCEQCQQPFELFKAI